MANPYGKKSKWEQVDTAIPDAAKGGTAYTPRYAQTPATYSPKRTVRSFRDLEVYQKMMECSIFINSELMPILIKDNFPVADGMVNCSMLIPLLIAEAHGMRFSNFARAVAILEQAMQGCNKMIVYLEQAQGLSNNADSAFIEDMMARYLQTRGKMLRLERSWMKFQGIPVRR